jgi:hypothetical protein
VARGGEIRWYDPKLGRYDWRRVPENDAEALAALEGSPHAPVCVETYRKWRELRAGIAAALIRAGEAALEAESGQ